MLGGRIRDGEYRRGPERVLRVPKAGGGGARPIIYFDHLMDQRWCAKHPGVPMLRYAADLLIMAGVRVAARRCFRDLKFLLVSTGLPLKNPRTEGSLWDLDGGVRVPWQGFSVSPHAVSQKASMRFRTKRKRWATGIGRTDAGGN